MKAKSSDNLIHTRSFTGLFRSLRISGAGFLFVLFFGTVWLNWGGRQAVLWDLSRKQIPYLRRDLLAAGFHPALGAADHRRVRPVCDHRVRRPGLVRLHLPAELLDLDLHVVRENHRRRTQPADQAASRAVGPEQADASLGQAHLVAGHQPADRPDLRRLLHADPATGRRTADLADGRRQPVLGAVFHRRHVHQCRLAA